MTDPSEPTEEPQPRIPSTYRMPQPEPEPETDEQFIDRVTERAARLWQATGGQQ